MTIHNGRIDWAEYKPLGQETEPQIPDLVLIYHTMVGYLRGTDSVFRAGGYTGDESTVGVGGPWDGAALDGVVWQWQLVGRQADAQYDGNAYADSAETSDGGHPYHPWSTKQLNSLVRLGVDYIHFTGREPVLVPRTGPIGRAAFGYHELRPEWNKDGHVCPGPVREAQLRQVVIPKIRAALSGTTHHVVVPTQPTGITVDGIFGTHTIVGLQHVLVNHGLHTGGIDGLFGPSTRDALQEYLHEKGYYHGAIDGAVGPITVKAWKAYLTHVGTFHGTIDGVWGHGLTAALQTALNEGKF